MQLLVIWNWLESHLFLIACLGSLAAVLIWLALLCGHLGRELTRSFFGRP